MPIPRPAPRRLLPLATLAGCVLAVATASAQKQDRKLEDRILHPDMTLHAEGFEKSFTPSGGGVNKTATVRLFGFSRPAALRGDGSFKTQSFASKAYKTEGYTTRALPEADRGAALSDRTFDTKTMPVRQDRAANKTADTQHFLPSEKPFISHGRRQDEIDELRRQKELTPDQVREILNKNR